MLDRSLHTFTDLIRDDLGGTQWQALHHDIIQRFTLAKQSTRLRYIGVVNWVYCSPIGKLIAKFLKPLELLPDQCARDTQFEFVINHQAEKINKQRRYFINSNTAFTFRSLFASQPELHEEFKAGLGMKLKLSVVQGDLLFQDQGYFWRIGSWRIPIPRWCSIGKFELLHHNINSLYFQVIIRISHPIFGVLFYQRGKFLKT